MEFSQQLFVLSLRLVVDKLGKIAAGLMDGKVMVVDWLDGLLV
jgi:hypothetical protein